jgi:DNA/RNA-binding domain of Phe-tRNA-synthetase-like protein
MASAKARFESAAEDTFQPALRRINLFETYFAENGVRCPLGEQFAAIRKKGLPTTGVLIQTLLFAEMSTGLLMGAQNAAAIKGDLVYDLAAAGESFKGMRSEVSCRENEIVVRDGDGIIASLLQGPDHRTRLLKDSVDLVFLVFSVPGITIDDVEHGIEVIRQALNGACRELHSRICQATSVALPSA